MKFHSKFVFTFLCLQVLFAFSGIAQSEEKKIKWQVLSTKDKEFSSLMPEGYQAFTNSDYYLGNYKSHVETHRTLARYINGVVLIIEFYEGDTKDIQEELSERQKGELLKHEILNGFKSWFYLEKTANSVWYRQHFLIKDRLYAIQAISREESNQIVRNFLESIRLANQKQVAAPNLAKEVRQTALTSLPEIVEIFPNKLDDSQPLIDGQADRRLILFYEPLARGFGLSGIVRLKALFSSSGKITKTEIISSPSSEFSKAAIDAAMQIQFLPAEKDGKLVSVFKTIEYNFSAR